MELGMPRLAQENLTSLQYTPLYLQQFLPGRSRFFVLKRLVEIGLDGKTQAL